MPQYSLHFLDVDGRAAGRQVVDAPTDAHAQQLAIALLERDPDYWRVEVWIGGRRIFSYERETRR